MEHFVFVGREGTVNVYVGAYLFKLFLYGLYASIFFFWMYIVSLHRRPMIWPFVTAAVLMFTIATADVAITLYYLFRYILNGKASPDAHPKALFFVTNNIFADLILLYRCYLGWSQKKALLSVPSGFLGVSSVCGYFFSYSTTAKFYKLFFVYLWMIFAVNTFLTLMIASRNFHSVRRARSILGSDVVRRYPALPATLMDSGVFYTLYLFTDLVARSVVLDAGLNQIVGIVPTLILIRLTLYVPAREDETDTDISSTPVLDSIFSSVGTDAQVSATMSQIELDAHVPTPSDERNKSA